MRGFYWCVLLMLLLSGCAGGPDTRREADRQLLAQARGPEENRRLHTDLIRQMIDEERLYAALAHLEAQEAEFGDTRQLTLLRAEILRKLGRGVEAERRYQKLLDTEYAGQAQHGLGLIYARRDLDLGIDYLRRAVQTRPTDARIRNDLGYALMKQGALDDARIHLATAYQLNSASQLSRNNYIVLLLLEGKERGARQIAAKNKVSEKRMTDLRKQAQSLQASVRASQPAVPAVGGGGG